MGVAAVFGIAAALLLSAGIYIRPRNVILSNLYLVGAGVVIALPCLGLLALFLHRNDPP